MAGILVWLGRIYTGFTLSSNGYYAGGCVISVKFHWPVFTILMSISQWVCFQLSTMFANNDWVSEATFEINHLKRHHIWRQFSSLLVHDSDKHLWKTINDQILIGCCLEIVNGWKPVALVYLGGALVSNMVDFFGGSDIRGRGAFGAVAALYAAYLATIVLNWKEVSAAKVRTCYLLFSLLTVFSAPFWYKFLVTVLQQLDEEFESLDENVSHADSIGGVLGGFVFGICGVKIFRKRLWKISLRKKFYYMAVILLAFVAFSLFCEPMLYSNVLQNSYLEKLLAIHYLLTEEIKRLTK